MNHWAQTPFFGIALTIFAFWIGVNVQKKLKIAIFNSIMIAAMVILLVLKLLGISLEAYFVGADLIHLMLGPATTCMAVSIYNKRDLLKKNFVPVLAGCLAGVLAHFVCVLLMSKLFKIEDALTLSLLPKSVTNPIATAISQEQGGVVSLTVAAVVVAGTLGNLAAPLMVKVFRIKNPMATGLGIGACSHAVGTARALEMGKTEGALSGLAIGICGIITAVLALAYGLFF